MGNRPKVDKQEFIKDIRAGLTREGLRSKYQMTQTAFQNLLNQLLEKERITNDDIRNLQVTAERAVVVDGFLRDPLLRLIAVVDQCNHAVKQGDWLQSDLDTFYQLKDWFMEKIYRNPPTGVEVKLKLVPYLRRCSKCKDQAGDAMRNEATSHNFEYYLERIPPCENDYEVAERATFEMELNYLGRMFCFHIPVQQAQGWGVDMTALERKKFIPAKEFNHIRFTPVFDEIRSLLSMLPPFTMPSEGTYTNMRLAGDGICWRKLEDCEGEFQIYIGFGSPGYSMRHGVIRVEMLTSLEHKQQNERLELLRQWYDNGQMHETAYTECDQGETCEDCYFAGEDCGYEFP